MACENPKEITQRNSPLKSATMKLSHRAINRMPIVFVLAGTIGLAGMGLAVAAEAGAGGNPIIRDCFTADPAPVVIGDTVYLVVDHDEAKEGELFTMKDWLCYTSTDMKRWTPHDPIMKVTDFKWAVKDAWAPQMIPRNGKYYFYAPVNHDPTHPGMAIGVAVANDPLGPYVDARGAALITSEMTLGPYLWPNIDPTIFIDDDGTPWLAWGNNICFLAKLKPTMTELDGPIQTLCLPNYTEGPWLWKHNGLYYLCYASFAHQGFPESISYGTAPKVTGPWKYRGEMTGPAKNSYTIHPGIVDDFHGQSYFFYHNASLTLPDGQTGATGRRAVCVEYLYYNSDGTIQPIEQTGEGVSVPPHPATGMPAGAVDRGTTDSGIKVTQFLGDYPTNWPGTPVFATVINPFAKTPQPVCFSRDGGVTNLGQTFVIGKDIQLSRIELYVGDGIGTSRTNTATIGLYDLGFAGANGDVTNAPADRYVVGANLLGEGNGLRFAYTPQGPGLLSIEFSEDMQVVLSAGHRYALELEGSRNSCPLCWYGSQYDYGYCDVYPDGAAYRNRKLVRNRDGITADFGFAIYGGTNYMSAYK
jgi:hypothetical protein